MDEKIDINTWQRKELFDFFGQVSNPFYMITFRQDVTNLYRYVKKNGLSFYYTLIYLCTEAVNHVAAFQYVIRGEDVYRLNRRMPSFTDLKEGSEAFHIVTLPCEGSISDFCAKAKEQSAVQTCFIDESTETDNLIYFSCVPWIDITAVTNERDLAAEGAKDESIPHITWGKYVPVGERMELGISIEVNHRLIDGLHIGRFAEELSRLIEELE